MIEMPKGQVKAVGVLTALLIIFEKGNLMLQEISIKNFAIIEEIHLSFESGMTILTGETGLKINYY